MNLADPMPVQQTQPTAEQFTRQGGLLSPAPGADPKLPTMADVVARIAAEVNRTIENIGARRLYTVMERVFEELSFNAPDRGGTAVTVDAAFVEVNLGALSRSTDLSRYVL